MPNLRTFRLPDLGEGLTEAQLLNWSVQVGDPVALNQIIAEVETAKAMVELPSPYPGRVARLHAQPGETVDVGAPLIDIDTAEECDTATPRVPVLVGYGVGGERPRRRRRIAADQSAAAAPQPVAERASRPLASPPVRFVARARNIDLAEVQPTGAQGEITRGDLDRHLSINTEPAAPADEIRTPIKGVRKHTAEAMVASAFTAPHVTIFTEVDLTPTLELLERFRQSERFGGIRLTPLVFVAHALLIALRGNPDLNAHWDESAQEIVTKRYVNLGIAAATPRGLMVPNIKDAQRLSLRELASALTDLTTRAKAGKTTATELSGGTITITNIGVFGIDSGTPILNPGEAAILCFGAVRRKPAEYRGEICLRSLTTLSLSFDHRLADGEQGSRFLATIAEILSDPLTLVALS